MSYTLHLGDCLSVMRDMDDCSVDAVVTDPPSGINFMGLSFDSDRGGRDYWVAWLTEIMTECLRVLKPGGHAFVWALPRTSHWTATAIEDAGFEIREVITRIQGAGFPKSLNVERAVAVKTCALDGRHFPGRLPDEEKRLPNDHICPTTPESAPWAGFGTSLKPASEHWILARKPLAAKNIAANVLATGCGALNIDQCRVGVNGERSLILSDRRSGNNTYGDGLQGSRADGTTTQGRWPSNLVLSHIGPDENGQGGCTPRGVKRVKSAVESVSDPNPHGVNIPIIRDTNNADAIVGEQRIEGAIPRGHAAPVMHVGFVDLDHQSSVRQEQVNAKAAVLADDKILMPDLFAAGLEPREDGVLDSRDGRDTPGGVHLRSVERHGRSAPIAAESGAFDGTEVPTVGPVDLGDLETERLTANEALAIDTATTTPDPQLSRAKLATGAADSLDRETGLDFNRGRLAADFTHDINGSHETSIPQYAATDKGLQVAAWDCEPGCPVAELSAQSNGGDRFFLTFPADPPDVPFRYVSKASRRERNEGCAGLPERTGGCLEGNADMANARKIGAHPDRPVASTTNHHPTVKPLALMEWLCKLITPPDGVILDPFAGSGSTGVAALRSGFSFVGVEQSEEYHAIAERRLQAAMGGQMALPLGAD